MPRILKNVINSPIFRNKLVNMMRRAGVDDAELSFQEITSAVLGRQKVINHDLEKITSKTLQKVESMCLERTKRKPLQYIIGEWDFRNLTLKMRDPVFIPRPETEQLVELALSVVQPLERGNVLEVGCGTGAITLSLLHECPQVECTAVDVSVEACNLTLDNADLCGLRSSRLSVHQCPLTPEGHLDCTSSTFDLVVSNPPYITANEMNDLQPEISRYEDVRSLCGGTDGLDVVRSLLQLCLGSVLKLGGTLLMEVGLEHPTKIKNMLEQESVWKPLVFCKAHMDFTGRQRFVEVTKQC